jgi:DNA-binding response OmpR family regulator
MEVLVVVLCGTVHVGLARASVRQGWSVLAVSNAVQAMREIRDRSPRLVVVQVSLLSSEPIKLIRLLRHCSQPVLIVAAANSHRNQLERLVRDAGASCYLPSTDDTQVVQAVSSMLGHVPAHVATGTTSCPIASLDPPIQLGRRTGKPARR